MIVVAGSGTSARHIFLQWLGVFSSFYSLEDIGDKFQGDEERHMPQHVGALAVADLPWGPRGCPGTDPLQVHIEGETEEQIEVATELIMPLPPWSLALAT